LKNLEVSSLTFGFVKCLLIEPTLSLQMMSLFMKASKESCNNSILHVVVMY